MDLTEQEKTDLLAEFKASINEDVKSDVEKISLMLADKLKRIDLIETKMGRLPIENPDEAGIENKSDRKRKGEFRYEVKSDYDKAFFDTYLRKGMKFLDPTEQKALILATDPAAGYLAPTEYAREVIKAMTEFSPIRAEATVRQTSSKAIEIPKRSALPDTHWISEISERVADESLEYKMETLTPHELISFKKVGLQQLEDSAFNLASELGEAFGEALGKKEGTAFVSGTGSLQPEGILTNADVGSTDTITASVLAANDIMAFPYTLPRGYRANAKWYLSDVMIATVRMMRADAIAPADGLGPFLWQNSLIGSEPPTLAGYPVVSCPDMGTTVEDGDVVAVFGDMRKSYLIVDRIQIAIQELRERYAEFGIIGYICRKRVAGQVVLPEAIRKLKIQAA